MRPAAFLAGVFLLSMRVHAQIPPDAAGWSQDLPHTAPGETEQQQFDVLLARVRSTPCAIIVQYRNAALITWTRGPGRSIKFSELRNDRAAQLADVARASDQTVRTIDEVLDDLSTFQLANKLESEREKIVAEWQRTGNSCAAADAHGR